MPRYFTLTFVVLLATTAWCQEDDDSRSITRDRRQIFASLNDQAPSTNAGMFVGVNKFTQDRGLNELAYAVHDAIETAYLFAFEVKLIRPDQCHLLLSGTPDNKIVQQHLDQLVRQGATVGSANRTEVLRTFVRVSRVANKATDSNSRRTVKAGCAWRNWGLAVLAVRGPIFLVTFLVGT